jgi:tetratricopeptide (TPR) repeat protein
VNWGNALVRLSRSAEAAEHYREAVRFDPRNADAYFNWGIALAQMNQLDDAIESFRRALAIDPARADARDYLEKAMRLRSPGANRP